MPASHTSRVEFGRPFPWEGPPYSGQYHCPLSTAWTQDVTRGASDKGEEEGDMPARGAGWVSPGPGTSSWPPWSGEGLTAAV